MNTTSVSPVAWSATFSVCVLPGGSKRYEPARLGGMFGCSRYDHSPASVNAWTSPVCLCGGSKIPGAKRDAHGETRAFDVGHQQLEPNAGCAGPIVGERQVVGGRVERFRHLDHRALLVYRYSQPNRLDGVAGVDQIPAHGQRFGEGKRIGDRLRVRHAAAVRRRARTARGSRRSATAVCRRRRRTASRPAWCELPKCLPPSVRPSSRGRRAGMVAAVRPHGHVDPAYARRTT